MSYSGGKVVVEKAQKKPPLGGRKAVLALTSLPVGSGAFCAGALPLYAYAAPGDSHNESGDEPRLKYQLAGPYG